jgi:predicted enzyme related to lactoylglutathione lyase
MYFEIQADDPGRAKNFYEAIFGWKFSRQEGAPVEYWHIDDGTGSGGGLLKRPAATPPIGTGTNAFVVSFEISNFDDAAKKIESLGGKVALPKFAVPGKCWQGYFLDTENNTFGLFQVDPNAK